jgi:hypothetical protein
MNDPVWVLPSFLRAAWRILIHGMLPLTLDPDVARARSTIIRISNYAWQIGSIPPDAGCVRSFGQNASRLAENSRTSLPFPVSACMAATLIASNTLPARTSPRLGAQRGHRGRQ